MSKSRTIVESIRKGEIDINNQSLFFPIITKGLLLKLKEQLCIRNIKIPHFILHTGDDTMYLSVKGQDASVEPLEISNEDYVYNSVPRCIVTLEGLNIETDQLTSPYIHGQLQYESDDELYTFVGEFRRVPLKLSVGCKYYVDSWRDAMELSQQIISKLAFIQTYTVSYLGQAIRCSYAIPTDLKDEYTMELDGTTQDNKLRTLEMSLEVETNFPYWEPRTIISNDNRVVYGFADGSATTETLNDPNRPKNVPFGKLTLHGTGYMKEDIEEDRGEIIEITPTEFPEEEDE